MYSQAITFVQIGHGRTYYCCFIDHFDDLANPENTSYYLSQITRGIAIGRGFYLGNISKPS